LANDFGIEVVFRETTPIYVERPAGSGEAIEVLHAESNPFHATLGLRVDPAPDGSGVDVRLQVDPRDVPLFVYKSLEGFAQHTEEYVRATLCEGLFGWQVTDCTVTMTRCNYSIADGPPSRRGPTSTAADFRKLTPIVLMQALEAAGTVVCEPFAHVDVEIPTATIGAVLPALARLGATVETPSPDGELSVVEALLPTARVHDLQRELSRLTGGEGVLESSFGGYRPVNGDQPRRRRTTANPLNLREYVRSVGQ
jgi:ribosomal protection tetracycline resistance protein